jgi:hypothetical protein
VNGRLTGRGIRARAFATALVLVLLLAGSLWGDDDHFPFGPMRMFSTTAARSGRVTTVKFEGVTPEGATVSLDAEAFGLRPAEIHGQLDRLRAHPELLRHLVTAFQRFNPAEPRLVELRLVVGLHDLRDRRAISYREDVIARWRE